LYKVSPHAGAIPASFIRNDKIFFWGEGKDSELKTFLTRLSS
jgi:hypothetical protein